MSKTKEKAIEQANAEPPKITIGAAAIKAREEKGGIVLRWREDKGKDSQELIVADGLWSDEFNEGRIKNILFCVEMRSLKEDKSGSILSSCLDQMWKCEKDHAFAVCSSIPNIKDEALHSIKMRKESKSISDFQIAESRAKSAHKIAKEELEDALARLATMAGEEIVPPLFKDKPVEKAGANDTAWREVGADELVKHGAPEGIIKKIKERSPSMSTLGQLSDWMNKKGEWWAKDLNCGCGPEKAAQISDAYNAWFLKNPEKCGGVKGTDTKPKANPLAVDHGEAKKPEVEDAPVFADPASQEGDASDE